jgi:hypothetical protein
MALAIIRREGAGFVQCIKAVYEVDRLSLSECKAAVHRSTAWSDESENREKFWDEVIRLFEQESNT